MSATKVNLDDMIYGVPEDEEGINIESFEQAFRFRKKDEVLNKGGGTRGVVYVDPRAELSLNGEVDGAGGLIVAAIGTAIELENTLSAHGVAAGDVLCDEITRTFNRDALATFSLSATRYPGIVTAP